ncbi:hypothetical protein DWF04_006075 [Cereibacter sphaeroides f. sp. denitrificans]|nr:hypothetical protein DWF04_06125 [Cereibacter sphaeroides f. sp. denitrificans]
MAFRTDPPAIDASAIIWDETGQEDPRSRLLAHIRVAGVDMHLEAIEVAETEDGQIAICDERRNDLGTLQDIEGTAFATVEIGGRDYVLYATPYGA